MFGLWLNTAIINYTSLANQGAPTRDFSTRKTPSGYSAVTVFPYTVKVPPPLFLTYLYIYIFTVSIHVVVVVVVVVVVAAVVTGGDGGGGSNGDFLEVDHSKGWDGN